MDPFLLAGAGAFGVGTALVGWLGRGREGRARLLAVACLAIPLSIGTWYLAMATGWGVTAGDRAVYWGRFADGIVTVPLVVFALGLLAGADRTTVATAMGVGAYTMATTLAATVATGAAGVAWFAVSVGGFLALLWLLAGPFTRAARDADRRRAALFARARTYVVVLFLLYPVPWILGAGGFGLAPGDWLVPVRLALDLALKVGFGILVLGSDAAVTLERRPAGQTASAGAGESD